MSEKTKTTGRKAATFTQKLNVQVTPVLYKQLQHEAETEGIILSNLVRRILGRFIKRTLGLWQPTESVDFLLQLPAREALELRYLALGSRKSELDLLRAALRNTVHMNREVVLLVDRYLRYRKTNDMPELSGLKFWHSWVTWQQTLKGR